MEKKHYILIGLLVVAAVLGWVILQKEKVPPKEEVIEEEIIIEEQLRELEELRGETQPLSEEEIQKQLEELEKLRQSQ